MFSGRKWLASAAFLSLVGTDLHSSAQDGSFPNRPITLVVPSSPGGLPDTMARTVAQHMSLKLGQQVIVENRTGAGGIIAAGFVANAPADGHTLLVGDQGQLAINPVLYKKIPYRPEDFVPVSMLGVSPLFLLAHPSVKANNLKELIALAKDNPKKYSYGSTGIGSLHHISMEILKNATGIDLVHVPYRGAGQSMPALISGAVQLVFSALPAAAGFVRSGKAKLIAVNSANRSEQAPEVPTIAEVLGIPGYSFPAEIGLLAPKGTPDEIVAKLAIAVGAALREPDTLKRFASLGIDPMGGSPEEFKALLEQQRGKYAQAVRTAGLQSAE
jgi:tripartite-type tricarboxylate transporter receptor subunit TctC